MKKIVCIILTIVLLAISFTACSGGSNGGENAKTMVQNYAQAFVNAWYYGLNEDCIYEAESCQEVFESEKHVDLVQLTQTTGFEQEKVKKVFMDDVGEISKKTVNNYHNTFIHFDTSKKVRTYVDSAAVKGQKPGITKKGYDTVCYNVEMVKYLFKTIYESDFMVLSNAEEKEVKTYIDSVIADCLDDSQFTNAVLINYEAVARKVQEVCNEKLGVQIQVKTTF